MSTSGKESPEETRDGKCWALAGLQPFPGPAREALALTRLLGYSPDALPLTSHLLFNVALITEHLSVF